MALFELVRVWDVYPRLTGSQVLRDLFRQVPTRSSGEEVRRVFATHTHIFVATKNPETRGDHLYGFSRVKEEGEKEGCLLLPVSVSQGQTVAVFDLEGGVCVVREWGQFEVFFQDNGGWRLTASAQLTTNDRVCSCAVHKNSNSIIYSSVPGPAESSIHQVSVCRYYLQGSDGVHRSVSLADTSNVLLSDCPDVELFPWRGGVAILPSQTPPGLFLLWLPTKPSQLLPFLLCDKSPTTHSLSSHYPTLCLQLVPLWNKASAQDDKYLVSMAVSIEVEELLILTLSGEVFTIDINVDRPQCRAVTKLKDFSKHYPQPKLHSTDFQLFSLHTYCGIFSKGDLRLYEMFSGEMVWESGEHESHQISLLTPPFSSHWIGIYDNSGVWMLRSQRLAEHTQLLSQALFPITTNADETTPGDYLEEGRVLAAKLCSLWNLPLPATKSALEALEGLVHRDREEGVTDIDIFLPHLTPENKLHLGYLQKFCSEICKSTELQSVLGHLSLQSPALLVALLAEHPRHRGLVTNSVKRFLETLDDDTPTPMTKEIAPLLMKYQSLSCTYEEKINESVTRPLLQTPSALTTSLLHRLQGESHQSREGLRAQLQLLSALLPSPSLSGIRDFFAVPNFSSAVEAIEAGQWDSTRDWKSVFGVEVGSGVTRKTLDPVVPNIPVFELTCRLLYREQPEELVPFVRFAQLARDHQAQGDSAFARSCRKTYFFQRAIQCLPVFVSKETTPVSREALLAHSLLLLQSEFSGCEGSALGLLLRGQLWEDSVVFLENEAIRSSHKYCSLFQSLLGTMAQESVLHCYIDRVWQLVPENFSVFDLLSLLARSPLHSPTPRLTGHDSLTVSDIGSRLLELLPRTSHNNV